MMLLIKLAWKYCLVALVCYFIGQSQKGPTCRCTFRGSGHLLVVLMNSHSLSISLTVKPLLVLLNALALYNPMAPLVQCALALNRSCQSSGQQLFLTSSTLEGSSLALYNYIRHSTIAMLN